MAPALSEEQVGVKGSSSGRIWLLYQYFHPDEVAGARVFSDVGRYLAGRGWRVVALPCNRSFPDNRAYVSEEEWAGIQIRRVWRPRLGQWSTPGRLLNALWMLLSWLIILLRADRQADAVIIGTDPVFSALISWPLKKLRPELFIIHWALDLYPEAAVAAGLMSPEAKLTRLLKRLAKKAYSHCDSIVDLGPCMRRRLDAYAHNVNAVTIVPSSSYEPGCTLMPNKAVRQALFGASDIGMLYSGTFGRAHSCHEVIELSRRLRREGVQMCWSVRGHAVEELRSALRPSDDNIRIINLAPEQETLKRLAAADIHVVSLRPEWAGVVVPSKFFASLAIGRPVLFAGPATSCIAQWIQQYQLGWVLSRSSIEEVALSILELRDTPEAMERLQRHCLRIYTEVFAWQHTQQMWSIEVDRAFKRRHEQSFVAAQGMKV